MMAKVGGFARLRLYLLRWGLWLRLLESLSWGMWGATLGLGMGLALALAARLRPLLLTRQLMPIVGGLVFVGMVAGVLAAWLRPWRLYRMARFFDRRLGLAERLTTAVEIGQRRLRTTRTLARLQLEDALEVARAVEIHRRLPLRAPRRPAPVFGALLCALLVSWNVPNPQEEVLLRRAAVRAAVEEQIEALESAREEIAQAEGLTEAEREALLQTLEETIAALDEGQATPEEAVAALSEAERALAGLQDPGAATVQEGLSRAATELSDSELTRGLAEALAVGDYRKAAQMLSSFAGTEGEMLTREQELELARELAQAAEAVKGGNPALAERLSRAAQAIEQGEITEARAAIQEAARQMEAAGQRVERQQAVEATLSRLQEGRQQVAQAGGT